MTVPDPLEREAREFLIQHGADELALTALLRRTREETQATVTEQFADAFEGAIADTTTDIDPTFGISRREVAEAFLRPTITAFRAAAAAIREAGRRDAPPPPSSGA